MDGQYYESSYGGADVMDTIRNYARDYSMWILGALVILIIYVAWAMFMKKENMYNPGSTAWFQLGNWKENMVDPATLNCASVDMAGYDAQDPYRYYVDTSGALSGSENFTDAQLRKSLY